MTKVNVEFGQHLIILLTRILTQYQYLAEIHSLETRGDDVTPKGTWHSRTLPTLGIPRHPIQSAQLTHRRKFHPQYKFQIEMPPFLKIMSAWISYGITYYLQISSVLPMFRPLKTRSNHRVRQSLRDVHHHYHIPLPSAFC